MEFSRQGRVLARVTWSHITVFALCVGSGAQDIPASYDPLSPEATTTSPAAVVLHADSCPSSYVAYTHTDLGLQSGDNIDAFSDGDIITRLGSAIGGPPAPSGYVQGLTLVGFSVDRATVGLPGSAVGEEASSDGAASDTFSTVFAIGGGSGTVLYSDAHCVTMRSPLETGG